MISLEDFAANNDYRYTPDDIEKAYSRYTKFIDGSTITLEEFLAEANVPNNDVEAATKVYSILYGLQGLEKISAKDVYCYARFKWCLNHPEAIVSYPLTGACKKWVVNNCDTAISNSDAIIAINKEWGFEASRINILGTPYYESSDWQFICFKCAGLSWVWFNEDLVQVLA